MSAKRVAAILMSAGALVTLGSGIASSQSDIEALVQGADAAVGQTVSFRCISCHSFGEGEASRIGPNLFGVVEREIGSVGDFAYSEALTALGTAGEVWTLELLDAFLLDPSGTVEGLGATKDPLISDMDRYNLLAYLVTLEQ